MPEILRFLFSSGGDPSLRSPCQPSPPSLSSESDSCIVQQPASARRSISVNAAIPIFHITHLCSSSRKNAPKHHIPSLKIFAFSRKILYFVCE